MTPQEFLSALWQNKPGNQYILIWTWPDRHSRWFTDVRAAADYVASVEGRDVYGGVGLSGQDYGPARRCVSKEITGIAGFNGDFDILSDAHKGKPLPETIEQALTILPPLMPPSLMILTGNGYQAWWLLKEPYIFDDDADRQRVARLAARWHTMLRLNSAARGWTYERLADLARVLRIPGTKNLKDKEHPKDVKLYRATDRQYVLSDFEDLLNAADIPDFAAQEQAAREWQQQHEGKPLAVNVDARIPQETLDAWMNPENSDPQTAMKFRNTWSRQRLKDPSNSGYDMALVDFGLEVGLDAQQIVDLIVHHRAHNGRDQKRDPGYFRRTIAKAVATRKEEGKPVPVGMDDPPPDATAPTGANAANGHAANIPQPADGGIPENLNEKAKLLLCDEISRALGVDILRIVKIDGEDPTYHMHTEKGIVEFERIETFTTYNCARNKIAAKTGILIRRFKADKWDALVQKMLNACIVEECTEEEEFEGSARAWVLDYLTETDFIPSVESQRIQDQRKPMIMDGHIAVCSSDFASYLEKTKNVKLTNKAAASKLKALGAKATARLRPTGSASQSRWALPLPNEAPPVSNGKGGGGTGFDPAVIKPGLVPAPAADTDAKTAATGETIQ